LLENRGVPLEKQKFTWRELVQKPISKLDSHWPIILSSLPAKDPS